jgi:hypothetical protein
LSFGPQDVISKTSEFGGFCYTLYMLKNLFVSDEEKKTSNTIAGIALVITLGILYFLIKPTDIYSYIITIVIALAVGGVVYFIAELIRKKRS